MKVSKSYLLHLYDDTSNNSKNDEALEQPAPSDMTLPETCVAEIFSDPTVFTEAEDLLANSRSDNQSQTHFLHISSVSLDKRRIPSNIKPLLSENIDFELDNFNLDDIVSVLRPHFLKQKRLFLGSIDLSLLAAASEKRNILSVSEQSAACLKIRDLINRFADKKTLFDQIDFVMLSSIDMAKRDSLVLTGDKSGAHYIYGNFCLKSGQVTLYDTLGLEFLSENPFLSEKAIKSVFKSILMSLTSVRSVKLSYQQTCFVQTGHVCGFLSLLHALLSYKYSFDMIMKYGFKNFIPSMNALKRYLVFVLIKKDLSLDTLSFN